jgi:hypothetical protein
MGAFSRNWKAFLPAALAHSPFSDRTFECYYDLCKSIAEEEEESLIENKYIQVLDALVEQHKPIGAILGVRPIDIKGGNFDDVHERVNEAQSSPSYCFPEILIIGPDGRICDKEKYSVKVKY